MEQKKLLGIVLLEDGHITREQLLDALRVQKEEGGLFGEVLLRLNYIDAKTLSAYIDGRVK